ncbi:hypothetical protein TELCIR_06835 [Teladorsagia circumcincta]|uniref:N-acetyltransferase ESCO acetyl-transferase domain-containing protein n=1 Tax=Teladorsagia circumcincta TaxID=45464 RepID=A0A2G9ULY4_TELCI|nr:hypothetical protein TELCIR_06835 [Teladorsagia circumcincta]
MASCTMQKQKRVTDFFSSPVAKKPSSLSPKLPIFDLEKKHSAKKKPRLSIDEHDTKQAMLDAGARMPLCDCAVNVKQGFPFISQSSCYEQNLCGLQFIKEIVNPSVGFAPDLSIWGWDERRTVWVSIITETIRPDDPIVGVNRLWTHPAARRKGIASETLDVVRKFYFTGVYVPRTRVAFSDPTDIGRRFAERYLRNEGQSNCSVLTYRVSK